MAPKMKATQSGISNLKPNLSSKGSPFPRPLDCNRHTRNPSPTHQGNISGEVTVEDWPQSDPESDEHHLFDFDGIGPGHGPEDNSDLSDSDTESDEAGDFNEIHKDAILLHFSETLQEAQRHAAEGNRKRWKEKKWTHYTGNSIRTQQSQAAKCRKIEVDGVQPFITSS